MVTSEYIAVGNSMFSNIKAAVVVTDNLVLFSTTWFIESESVAGIFLDRQPPNHDMVTYY